MARFYSFVHKLDKIFDIRPHWGSLTTPTQAETNVVLYLLVFIYINLYLLLLILFIYLFSFIHKSTVADLMAKAFFTSQPRVVGPALGALLFEN